MSHFRRILWFLETVFFSRQTRLISRPAKTLRYELILSGSWTPNPKFNCSIVSRCSRDSFPVRRKHYSEDLVRMALERAAYMPIDNNGWLIYWWRCCFVKFICWLFSKNTRKAMSFVDWYLVLSAPTSGRLGIQTTQRCWWIIKIFELLRGY